MSEIKTITIKTKFDDTGVKNLNNELTEVNENQKNINESTTKLTGTLDKLTGGAITKFKNFKSGLGGVATGFKSVGAAIAASGIGLLVVVVSSLIAAFKNSEAGQNKFAKLMGVIGTVVGNVVDVLADLGDFIIDLFSGNGEAMSKLKSFGASIFNVIGLPIKTVIDTVKTLGKVLGALFSGDVSGAFDALKQGVSDVKGNFDEAADSINNAKDALTGFIEENIREAKIAQQIADDRAKADVIDRDLIVERAKADRRIAELRDKAAQREKFSAEERKKALIEASKISEDITNKEIEAAKLRRDAIIEENKLSGSNKDDLIAEAEAKAAVIQLETQRLKLQKSLSAELVTTSREQAALAKAERERKEKEAEELAKRPKDLKAAPSSDDVKSDPEIIRQQALSDAKLDILLKGLAEEERLKLLAEATDERLAEQQRRREQALASYKIDTAVNVFGALQGIAEEGSAGAKAIALAQAVLSTYQGINKALAETTDFTPSQTLRFLNAAAVGVAGFANVAKILSTDSSGKTKPSLSGGTGGGVKAPSFNVVGTSGVNQLADSLNQDQQPIQAFVVGSEVTSQQELDNQTQATATVG